jgi:hypothetical protein
VYRIEEIEKAAKVRRTVEPQREHWFEIYNWGMELNQLIV